MKKTILCVIACLLAVFLVATCFAGCSKSSDEKGTTAAVVTKPEGEIGGALEDGTYKLINVYDLDGNEDSTGLKLLKKLEENGINIDLVVNGQSITMTGNDYTLQDGKLVGEEGTFSYAVNGNQVTVFDEADNSKMIFEK